MISKSGKELERRGGKPLKVARSMEQLWKKAFEKRGFTNREILTNWSRIVGPNLALRSEPIKLVWAADRENRQDLGATLHIKVEGAANLEFQHSQTQIISRINSFFGYRAVTGLRLVQAPVIKRTERASPNRILSEEDKTVITHTTQSVQDNSLKQALNRLGAGVFSKNKR